MTVSSQARLGAILVTMALAVLAVAPDAHAHARLIASDPPNGATVEEAPEEIALRFNESISSDFATVQVVDEAGDRFDADTPRVEDDHAFAPLLELPEAGTYTVNWRVVSADSHPIEGTFSFTYSGPPAEPEPADNPEPEPEPAPEPEPEPDPEPAPAPEPTATASPTEAGDDLASSQDPGSSGIPAGVLVGAAAALVVLAGIGYLVTRGRGGAQEP